MTLRLHISGCQYAILISACILTLVSDKAITSSFYETLWDSFNPFIGLIKSSCYVVLMLGLEVTGRPGVAWDTKQAKRIATVSCFLNCALHFYIASTQLQYTGNHIRILMYLRAHQCYLHNYIIVCKRDMQDVCNVKMRTSEVTMHLYMLKCICC